MVSVSVREIILIQHYSEKRQEIFCRVQVHHSEEPGLDCQHQGGGGAARVRDAVSRCDQQSVMSSPKYVFMINKVLSHF